MVRIHAPSGVASSLFLLGGVASCSFLRTPLHVRTLPGFMHTQWGLKNVDATTRKERPTAISNVRQLAKWSDEEKQREQLQNEGYKKSCSVVAFSAMAAMMGSGVLAPTTIPANALDDKILSSPPRESRTSTKVNPVLKSHQQSLFGDSIMLSLDDDESLSLMDTPSVTPVVEDDAGETVENTIRALKASAGDPEKSLKVFEDIAAIITEGRGVGGALSYTGAKLDASRYSVDEDTSIYNPGLSLLTESEKESLVEGIVANRKVGLEKGAWPEDNEFGFDFLKSKLDPFHLTEIRGYLKILPFWGAAMYMLVLAVQQLARDYFAPAYVVAAGLVFGPMAALIVLGS